MFYYFTIKDKKIKNLTSFTLVKQNKKHWHKATQLK